MGRHERILALLLRVFGGVTVLAFPTMLLPSEWMAAIHRWLGLGVFPQAPIVDYLTRSVASLYGFHGVLVLIVSSHPTRYRIIVQYLGVMYVASGIIALVIDLLAPMPLWWTLIEGPPLVLTGVLILYLLRLARSEAPQRPG